jgi:hypothetical protein
MASLLIDLRPSEQSGGGSLPPGGTTGQVLTKASNADGDAIWSSTSGGVTDHGLLTGLGDDDHSQYHNDARGDARYYTKTQLDAGQLDTRYYTETEVDAALTNKQDFIVAGTTTQYYRGDKVMASLTKGAVGLGNVDNTSDLNKPISTATQAALDPLQAHVAARPANSIASDLLISDTTNTATGLKFAVGANQKWAAVFHVFLATGGSNGMTFSFSTPSGTTGRGRYQSTSNGTAATTTNPRADLSASANNLCAISGSPYAEHVFTFNTTTAGDIELFLQNTNTQNTTVTKESFVTAFRLS